MQKIAAVVINVPGSMISPYLSRLDTFKQQWEAAKLDDIATLKVLENVCTPTEVLADFELKSFAKHHDTFIQPRLRRRILGVSDAHELTPDDKADANVRVQNLIATNWDDLVKILCKLGFKCRDVENVRPYAERTIWTPEALSEILDALRTKITRTACTESHKRAYRYLNETKADVGLLFEDDVVMLPGFKEQISEIAAWLDEHKPNWNFVQLGWSKLADRPAELRPIANSLVSKSSNGAFGNMAMLVNLRIDTAWVIMDRFTSNRYLGENHEINPNDLVLCKCVERGVLNGYLATTRLVGPPAHAYPSVICGTAMDYTNVCWDPEQIRELQK